QPPHEVVEHDERKRTRRKLARSDGHHPADGTEEFSGEADGDEGKGAVEPPRCIRVADAIQTDHHAQTREDAGIARVRKTKHAEELTWDERRPQSERDVV